MKSLFTKANSNLFHFSFNESEHQVRVITTIFTEESLRNQKNLQLHRLNL